MIERVFEHTLSEKDRDWLALAAESSLESQAAEDYVLHLMSGQLGLWRLWGKGLIGISRTNKVLWIEFLVGDGLTVYREDILGWLTKLAEGRRIEALPSRKGMIRRLEQLGFKPVSTLMRLELTDEQRAT